jgi:hypothetical protein
MKKIRSLRLFLAALAAASLLSLPHPARAQGDLTNIDVTYYGGPLIQKVHVFTVFWGPDWKGSRTPDYVNGFFQTLFKDGRFLDNLTQYNANGYTISNGTYVGTTIDDTPVANTLTDAQIRAEIQAQAAAGKFPPINSDALYFVFTPPGVLVTDRNGADSGIDFAGYHDFASEASFAYSVIPFPSPGDELIPGASTADELTIAASHEMAEAVTDPEPTRSSLGWYDENNGEIGDIPIAMYDAGMITESGLVDHLQGPDGTVYAVQKVWSNYDSRPVAFPE